MESTNYYSVSQDNTEHYTWGEGCDGWHYLKTEGLSIIRESMPSGTQENWHYHEKAQQFFFIIAGAATFYIDEKIIEIKAGAGITVPPLIKHKIANSEPTPLEFLVISAPKSHGDRINLEEL